jgi:hypothetical protein
MDVDTCPDEMPELESEKPYCTDLSMDVTTRVVGRLRDQIDLVSKTKILECKRLAGMSVLKFDQASNYPLTKDEGECLLAMLGIGRLA